MPYENKTGIQQTLAKFTQILAIRNKKCKQTLFQKLPRIKVHNAMAVWLSPFCYMEAKFGPIRPIHA
jgi:hypothetical protein